MEYKKDDIFGVGIVKITPELLAGHFPPPSDNIEYCSINDYNQFALFKPCSTPKTWHKYHMKLCLLYAKIEHVDISHNEISNHINNSKGLSKLWHKESLECYPKDERILNIAAIEILERSIK